MSASSLADQATAQATALIPSATTFAGKLNTTFWTPLTAPYASFYQGIITDARMKAPNPIITAVVGSCANADLGIRVCSATAGVGGATIVLSGNPSVPASFNVNWYYSPSLVIPV
jgi:hypothetical protein